MDEDDVMDGFVAARPRLTAIARRVLGSTAEAEDAVQDAWLRLARADQRGIDDLDRWLTTVVGRVCVDRLRRRASRPQEVAGLGHVHDRPGAAQDPADVALVADAVGAALSTVVGRLAPPERVAFVLHDGFGVPFDEIAPILDRSTEAVRQLASRARRRVQEHPRGEAVDPTVQRRVVCAFLAAARSGDTNGLVALLAPDVKLVVDDAAIAQGALRPVRGAAEVAERLSGGARGAQLALVDGLTAFVWAPQGRCRGVVRFVVRSERIVSIEVTGDPGLLATFEIVALPTP